MDLAIWAASSSTGATSSSSPVAVDTLVGSVVVVWCGGDSFLLKSDWTWDAHLGYWLSALGDCGSLAFLYLSVLPLLVDWSPPWPWFGVTSSC